MDKPLGYELRTESSTLSVKAILKKQLETEFKQNMRVFQHWKFFRDDTLQI